MSENAGAAWPKFFEMDKSFCLYICDLVTNSRFVPIYMLFKAIWKKGFGAKAVFFRVRNALFSGIYYIVLI